METLDWSIRVEGKNGFHDKILLRIENVFLVAGITESIDGFRHLLSIATVRVLASDATDAEAVFGRGGWLFNVPQDYYGSRDALKVRTNNLKSEVDKSIVLVRPPLFSGNLFFSGYFNRNQDDVRSSLVSCEFHLNPTRYIRHSPRLRPKPRDIPGFYEAWKYYEELSKREGGISNAGETSLDGNDNFLPQNGIHQCFLEYPALFRIKERRYINSITEAFNSEFRRAVEESGVMLYTVHRDEQGRGREKRFNLQYVETYFEFSCEAANDLVRSIEDLIFSFGGTDAVARDYPIQNGEAEEQEEPLTQRSELKKNSRSIRKTIQVGIELAVYPKTNTRVRFEIRHDLRKCSLSFMPVSGRHTTTELNGVHKMLESVRNHAAQKLNEVFAYAESETTVLANSVPVSQFLADFVRVAGDNPHSDSILNCLIQNRRFISDSETSQILKKLRGEGILENVNRGRSNRATAPYRHALNQLRELDSPPRLYQIARRSMRVSRRQNRQEAE